ncbi:MAG TPA: PIN domain-containing protein [Pyrinomonadaceae bacterium]|nr:PIN domain-containing protein [Pyrinomonadaceae bacterium]
MPPKQPTFVDASVLINAIVGSDAARKMRALSVLGDPDREFVATRFLQLEVIPIPLKFNKKKEAAFYARFFKGVTTWVDPASIIQSAYDLACQHGLGAIDALHLAAARAARAEFVSAERPTKPIYSAYPNAVSIY